MQNGNDLELFSTPLHIKYFPLYDISICIEHLCKAIGYRSAFFFLHLRTQRRSGYPCYCANTTVCVKEEEESATCSSSMVILVPLFYNSYW